MMSTIPVIGQPFTVYEVDPVVLMTCKCQSDNPPLVLMGVNLGRTCPQCKKTYIITKVMFDRVSGQSATAEVGCVLATATTPLLQ